MLPQPRGPASGKRTMGRGGRSPAALYEDILERAVQVRAQVRGRASAAAFVYAAAARGAVEIDQLRRDRNGSGGCLGGDGGERLRRVFWGSFR